ncbi:hypothetical protein AMTRI_Chr04g253650 [Amborella trichopoda]
MLFPQFPFLNPSLTWKCTCALSSRAPLPPFSPIQSCSHAECSFISFCPSSCTLYTLALFPLSISNLSLRNPRLATPSSCIPSFIPSPNLISPPHHFPPNSSPPLLSPHVPTLLPPLAHLIKL